MENNINLTNLAEILETYAAQIREAEKSRKKLEKIRMKIKDEIEEIVGQITLIQYANPETDISKITEYVRGMSRVSDIVEEIINEN